MLSLHPQIAGRRALKARTSKKSTGKNRTADSHSFISIVKGDVHMLSLHPQIAGRRALKARTSKKQHG